MNGRRGLLNLTKATSAPVAASARSKNKKAGARMKLSIIVPVYNEAESLDLLYGAIEKAVSGLDADWEAVLVDDGSKDGSLKVRESAANPTKPGWWCCAAISVRPPPLPPALTIPSAT